MQYRIIFFSVVSVFFIYYFLGKVFAQNRSNDKNNLVYVDKQGALRYPSGMNKLSVDSILLLTRTYPASLPLWIKNSEKSEKLKLSDAGKIQVVIGTNVPSSEYKNLIVLKWINMASKRQLIFQNPIQTNCNYANTQT